VRESAHKHGMRVILSYHNFGYTPGLDFLVQRFLEAERLGGDVAKVAVMPRDRADVLTLLAATAQADAKGRIPLISMAMGPLGSVTRMIGGEFGSSAQFAVGEGSSAPGQIPIADPPRCSPSCAARGAAEAAGWNAQKLAGLRRSGRQALWCSVAPS
jgi:3-dehydroquinate dehydratase-1